MILELNKRRNSRAVDQTLPAKKVYSSHLLCPNMFLCCNCFVEFYPHRGWYRVKGDVDVLRGESSGPL